MEEILHALECGDNDVPQKFPDPFRYAPCPAVIMAAGKVISHIDSDRSLHDAMSEGKMLGVLVVRTDGGYGFLAAFSGNAGGRNSLPYFCMWQSAQRRHRRAPARCTELSHCTELSA